MKHNLTVKGQSQSSCHSLQQKIEHFLVGIRSTEHWSVKQLQPGDARWTENWTVNVSYGQSSLKYVFVTFTAVSLLFSVS